MEIFKPVRDMEEYYEISNFGNLLLKRTNKLTKGYLNNYGYFYVTCKINGKRKNHLIHRLVAEMFIPNLENKLCINHKDGNKQNNCVENLEWCTHSENMNHAVKLGLSTNASQKGDLHNTCKHSFEEILKIRKLYSEQNISMRTLANMFNCGSGYVSDVINNKIRRSC